MTGVLKRFPINVAYVWLALTSMAGATETLAPPLQVLISVPDQRLAVVRDGQLVARFPISTSRFGTGDSFYSYRTPLGALRVCDKIGGNLPPGAVIHHRSATGEVLPVNAPGRDPICDACDLAGWTGAAEPERANPRHLHSRNAPGVDDWETNEAGAASGCGRRM